MTAEIRILFLIALLFVPLLAETQYECGAHGRFEYCVDGVSGCVLGCHCHPGYYFDTDSKICEPNIKLTQDFRRQYLPEPTRIQVAPITSPIEENPITPNAVDVKVDEITKDADDLGDWLYNQFFKTIENQVINKTQDEELPPTRRSGDILLKKPSRRSHIYRKGKKKKKKKSKSKGLKSKLLRITEDDSLFDSDSGYTTYEDSSSSSSESESSADDKSEKKKDNDHGHKKILIFNTKPQPPLPSFVFLPNMDTPYYPPIGLPPPPVMPMYPMVPVPPMMPGPPVGGPLFPYPGVPPQHDKESVASKTDSTLAASTIILTTEKSDTMTKTDTTEANTVRTTAALDTTSAPESTTTSSPKSTTTSSPKSTTTSSPKSTTTSSPKSTTTSSAESTTTSSAESTNNPDEPTSDAPDVTPNLLRHRHKKRKKPIAKANTKNSIPTNPVFRGNRNKQLFKKLREKLNRKNKLENYFADQYQEPDPLVYGNDHSEFIPKRNFRPPDMNEMLQPEDVDFKYLAELIHKADPNKTLNNRPNLNKPNINLPINEPIVSHPSRRNYYPENSMNNGPGNSVMRQKSRMEDPNDSFYTNLGKQIASMIRKIDSNEEREVNIEIEGNKQQSQTSPIFNDNNYASRSFWERSVRSPLKYLNTFKKQMDNLKNSNEDLFSLENKVEIAATTTHKLTLHDLENIISNVKIIKPKRNNNYQEESEHSNASFKLNLLPDNKLTIQPVPKPKSVPIQVFQEQKTRRKQAEPDNLLLSKFRQLFPEYKVSITSTETPRYRPQDLYPTRKPSPLLHMPNTMTTLPNKTNLQYQFNPVLSNQRTLNYRTYNSNPYHFENLQPIPYPGINKSSVPYGRIEKSSYFHHDFHHFDYFDK